MYELYINTYNIIGFVHRYAEMNITMLHENIMIANLNILLILNPRTYFTNSLRIKS